MMDVEQAREAAEYERLIAATAEAEREQTDKIRDDM